MTNPDIHRSRAGRRDASMGMRRSPRQLILAAAGLSVVVLGASLSACSTKGGQPASAPSSSPASPTTTVMIDGNKHTMIAGVNCTSSAAQPKAMPPESGDLTMRISVHDDSSSVTLALSDEKPPSVDGVAISLTAGTDQYQLPYQPAEPRTQVQTTRDGKGFTVTGTGEAMTPGQSGMHQVTFGIHVTCP